MYEPGKGFKRSRIPLALNTTESYWPCEIPETLSVTTSTVFTKHVKPASANVLT